MSENKKIKVAAAEGSCELKPGDTVTFAFGTTFHTSTGDLETICELQLENRDGVLWCVGPLSVTETKETAAKGIKITSIGPTQ